MNTIYIDTEYTGFYSTYKDKSGELLQVSACAIVDGMLETFDEYCRPLTNVWSDEAEKVHRISKDRAMLFQHPNQLAESFVRWLERIGGYNRLAGWNCKGDKMFIERLMFDHKLDQRYFSVTRLEWKDVLDKAKKRKDYIGTKDLKLESVAKFFSIPIKAHNSLSDATATMECDKALSTIDLPSEYAIQDDIGIELSEKDKVKKYMGSKYIQIDGDGTIFITPHATHNKEAMQTIFSELWGRFCD